jgi:alkanesulfonate monooxygenase SsuD/methylene tetrahydromethanopterin reductase-like flavin-dependent oxidoreductase (luciferase family)
MKFGYFLPFHNIDGIKAPREVYDEALDLAVRAENLGYDYLWIPEHHLIQHIIAPDLLQLVIYIADHTEHIQIGAAVFISPFHHPLQLAGAIAQADHLTRGRFEPGIGRGSVQYEMRQFQVDKPDDQARQRSFEFMDVIRKVWERDEPLEYHGKEFDFDNAYVVPRPYTKPHPRIWAAATSRASAEAAGKGGYDLLFSPLRRPFSVVEDAFEGFSTAIAEHEQPHDPVGMTINWMTYVAPTMRDAREVVPYIEKVHKISEGGRQDREKVVKAMRTPDVDHQLSEEDALANLLVGDAETVKDKLRICEVLGLGQVSTYTAFGLPTRMVHRSMDLFAQAAFPDFKGSGTVRSARPARGSAEVSNA